MVDWRETSFGRMRTIEFGGTEIELLRFDSEGSDHTHDEYEHAACIEGLGWVQVGDAREFAPARTFVTIDPGVPHRMIPVEGHDRPYLWLLWYSADRLMALNQQIAKEVPF